MIRQEGNSALVGAARLGRVSPGCAVSGRCQLSRVPLAPASEPSTSLGGISELPLDLAAGTGRHGEGSQESLARWARDAWPAEPSHWPVCLGEGLRPGGYGPRLDTPSRPQGKEKSEGTIGRQGQTYSVYSDLARCSDGLLLSRMPGRDQSINQSLSLSVLH